MVARSKFYEVKNVNVHELLLDPFNPRIRHGIDQHDCTDRIVKDRDTFLNLLRDIATHGLSPEHILIAKNQDGKWVIRDGNRRVTALKLLTRPTACLPDLPLYNLVQRLTKDMPAKILETINCLACDDEPTIVDYLQRKHTGENAGVGQVRWNALLISLFNLHEGIPDQNKRAAQLILWAEEHGLSIANDFPITTLTRVLKTETLGLLGFEVKDDQLVGILAENQNYALVARVINDIAAGRVNVTRDGQEGSIYSPEDAEAYFRRVREETGPAMASAPEQPEPQPNPAGGEGTPSSSSGAAAQGGNPSGGQGGATTNPDNPEPGQGRPPNGSPVKPYWDRPCLFGKRKNSTPGFAVPGDEPKVITILAELRQLDPNNTALAVTMLLRALIERSDFSYREKHSISDKGALHKNIAASADHMKSADLLNSAEHEVVMRHTRSDAGMLHIKTIQSYVHEATFHPNGQALNTMWDEIGCFVRACWA